MFLSLVRPERISSPITRTAAVTAGCALALSFITLPCRFGSARRVACHRARWPRKTPRHERCPTRRAERAADGSLLIRSATPLAPHDPSLARMFRAAAATQPARTFLAERAGEGWRTVTYAQARASVDALAQALIDRRLSAERPVMILSGNAIDHALLMLAGFTAGVPVAPISVAYSLQSQDHAKLKQIAELLAPGLVYVNDTAPFARALAALDPGVE